MFFIVLDLRLTKVGARRCSFFYVYTSDSVSYTHLRYEIEKITYPVHYDRYRIFLNFTYNIKPVGTYLVEVVDGRGFLKKTTNYAESIYIESGTGSFTFKKEGGQKEYSGISTYIDFTWD